MEIKRFTQQLVVLFFAFVMTASAWAQGGSGTASDPLTIASKADWKVFCERVNAGQTNINVKLTSDIDLGKDIIMVGTENDYTGTFDGNGHSITVDWTTTEPRIAPFLSVDNATIKNLRIKGQITSSNYVLTGLIIFASGTTTVTGCVIDVNLTTTFDETVCESAGMIAGLQMNSKAVITDCVVRGSLNTEPHGGNRGVAGFLYFFGWNATATIKNCLYAGTTNNVDSCATFAHTNDITNCYYLNHCGYEQGTKITDEQLKSGAVAWMLQNGRSDMAWGQAIGTDEQPLPTNDVDKRVCKVEFTYNNKVAAVRYANSGGKVQLPTAKELLGEAYDETKIYTLTFDHGFSETTPVGGDLTLKVDIDITTGIDEVKGNDAIEANSAVYDLQGRRVAEKSDDATLRSLPSGVYIVNGKSVVVRR